MEDDLRKTPLPIISIIIPCYNSGEFLPEALESIKTYPDKTKYEVIIVDDGSTDAPTLSLLDHLVEEGYRVIHQENKGPAAARNTGIKICRGEYLLLLDSDNKIRGLYIEKGIETLNANKEIGVVYGNPNFFGEVDEERLFTPKDFDLTAMLFGNYIDMCSIIRKKTWEQVGGFDENRIIIGFEDWDFWIMSAVAGWKFFFIDEVLFDYRIRSGSLINHASLPDRLSKSYQYIFNKHWDVFLEEYIKLYNKSQFYKKDQAAPFRSFFKFIYYKYISKKRKGIYRKDQASIS